MSMSCFFQIYSEGHLYIYSAYLKLSDQHTRIYNTSCIACVALSVYKGRGGVIRGYFQLDLVDLRLIERIEEEISAVTMKAIMTTNMTVTSGWYSDDRKVDMLHAMQTQRYETHKAVPSQARESHPSGVYYHHFTSEIYGEEAITPIIFFFLGSHSGHMESMLTTK